jgi:uncharacterized membrane protein SpoIIM required for sporulation
MIVRPRSAERQPWHMFIVGLVYASVSLLLVSFVFYNDSVLSKYSGILVVTFTVICSLPFMYYIIKLEENKEVEIKDNGRLLKEHSKAIRSLMWLFLGFVVAFSIWYMVLPGYTPKNFNAQIEVFCSINSPANYEGCLGQHGIVLTGDAITAGASKTGMLFGIFSNNIYVLIFTILFSLAFGAGAIFILAWNASVIAAAIGIFTKSDLLKLPLGLGRYMIHGVPEIAAYFIGALAGGIISVAVIRKDLQGERMWKILQDSLLLIIIAIVILIVAAIIEVYVTPVLF